MTTTLIVFSLFSKLKQEVMSDSGRSSQSSLFTLMFCCVFWGFVLFTFFNKQVNANEQLKNNLLACQLPSSSYQGGDEKDVNTSLVSALKQGPFRFLLNKEKQQPLFDFSADVPFQNYLAFSYQKVQAENPRAMQNCALPSVIENSAYQYLVKSKQRAKTPSVADLLAPFELRQNNAKKAVLLVHGLTDSPYHFFDLARYFFEQGFNVRTLLLPAHGTAPQALIDVEAQQWQHAVDYAVKQTLNDFEQVYIGGYSLGGALMVNHLLRASSETQLTRYKKLKGVLLWAPVIETKNKQAWLASYLNYIPGFTWLEELPDDDFAKYESFPVNAAAQVNTIVEENQTLFNHLLSAAKNEQINSISQVPVFMTLTDVDNTIDSQSAANWLAQLRNKVPAKQKDTVVMYQTLNEQAAVPLKTKKLDSHIDYIETNVSPKKAYGAISIAHTAILNAPSNSHYGVSALYKNCSHWLNEAEKFISCKRKAEHQGEITSSNLAMYPQMARLTFNPYFDEMLDHLSAFIEKTNR